MVFPLDEDYFCLDRILIFSQAVSSVNVTCSISNNHVVDGTRKFLVMLTALNRYVEFDEPIAMITITDDDSKLFYCSSS